MSDFTVTYTLMPDVAGKFLTKTTSLEEFARDAHGIFVRKMIPPLPILNAALRAGVTAREADWDPFEIDADQYDALIATIVGEPPLGFRLTKPPLDVTTHRAWIEWVNWLY